MRGAPIGNKNGAKKNRAFRDALDRANAQDEGKRVREAAEALLTSAANGDLLAIKELRDTLDGKPNQSIDIGGAVTVASAVSDLTAFLVEAAGHEALAGITGVGEGRPVVSPALPAATH